jgi:hypothetical protein
MFKNLSFYRNILMNNQKYVMKGKGRSKLVVTQSELIFKKSDITHVNKGFSVNESAPDFPDINTGVT